MPAITAISMIKRSTWVFLYSFCYAGIQHRLHKLSHYTMPEFVWLGFKAHFLETGGTLFPLRKGGTTQKANF